MKQIVSLTLEAELLERIREKADSENRSVSNYVENIIAKAIEKEK